MMPRSAAGHQVFPCLCAGQCTGRGMVDLWAALQAFLKFRRALADIVGIAQHIAPVRFSKAGCKPGAPLCRSAQVVFHRLRRSVFPNMCIKHNFHH